MLLLQSLRPGFIFAVIIIAVVCRKLVHLDDRMVKKMLMPGLQALDVFHVVKLLLKMQMPGLQALDFFLL